MADSLFFSRNTKVYALSTGAATEQFEIPVLDGFSFTQAMDTQEISLSEATNSSGNSRRGRQIFNNALQPGEWSFQTYIRPFTATGNGSSGDSSTGTYTSGDEHLVDEILWANLCGLGTFNGTDFLNITSSGSGGSISFGASNLPQLGEFTMTVVLNEGQTGESIYTLAKCVVNEVTIDFDIEGIATASWSGFFQTMTESGSDPTATANDEGTTSTTNYIANKLSSCDLVATGTSAGSSSKTYGVTLTGGSITISNNITFLTPNTLASVNTPLTHVTGTRSVSGNLTMYLSDDGSGNDSVVDLFEDMSEDVTSQTQDFTLDINIGGDSGNRMSIDMNNVHLEIPTLAFDDVISLDVAFHALPTSFDLADEIEAITFDV